MIRHRYRGSNRPHRFRHAFEALEERRLLDANALVGLDLFRADPRFAGIDGHGYSVVVIDHGADIDHPYFGPDADQNGVADRIVFQYDFGDNDGDASDTNGHGTNVAGVVGSQDAAHPGVAPGCNLIVLKLFKSGPGDTVISDLEAPLQWIEQHVAQYNIVAVNLSITDGGNYGQIHTETSISDEFSRLAGMGVIVVAAAGNDFKADGSVAGIGYPAADPNVIAVSGVWADDYGRQDFGGAVNETTGADQVAAFSQRDPVLTDIFAPAGYVNTAAIGGGFTSRRGTSFAAPFVTGTVVLAQQLAEQEMDRRLSVSEFRDLLKTTGVIINDGDDENDNVINTGADYRRLNILALGESLLVEPGPPTLSVSDLTFTEGDAGETMAAVVVQISRAPSTIVTVDYATSDDTATVAGNDYVQTVGQLTFEPGGPLSQTILVPIIGDRRFEPTETFHVILTGATNANLLEPQAAITILDNDRPLPWRNPTNALDVNHNGFVSGLDALIIINKLNTTGAEVLPEEPPVGVYPFYDVNGDGRLTALDALSVINFLNGVGGGQPAGAALAPAAVEAAAETSQTMAEPTVVVAPRIDESGVGTVTVANPACLPDERVTAPHRSAAVASLAPAIIANGRELGAPRQPAAAAAARAAWHFFWSEYGEQTAQDAFRPFRRRR